MDHQTVAVTTAASHRPHTRPNSTQILTRPAAAQQLPHPINSPSSSESDEAAAFHDVYRELVRWREQLRAHAALVEAEQRRLQKQRVAAAELQDKLDVERAQLLAEQRRWEEQNKQRQEEQQQEEQQQEEEQQLDLLPKGHRVYIQQLRNTGSSSDKKAFQQACKAAAREGLDVAAVEEQVRAISTAVRDRRTYAALDGLGKVHELLLAGLPARL
ncbi:uncharacterized protein RHO25_013208 [Cercospora beticola]|uniref:Uncharacterized protein n=1 Tax=Cercospora beticola TaxID=122368 RepID=A0ABZ0P9G1_CERBT|nr:hypothetical protein RHO25_013208 [Cercospora beticola]